MKTRPDNTAVGVDLDQPTLDWGMTHNVKPLGEDATRLTLKCADVREVSEPKVDIVAALNFSYFEFKTRDELREYFRIARNNLARDGILFLDAFGGYDAFRELKEKTRHKGFTYVWEQATFNPIDGSMTCNIHFEFPDGSRLGNAFSYEWRLWTLPEVRELLAEAGFGEITVYWEGTDEESNEGNGIYEPAEVGDADPGWVCYIVAQR